MKMILMSGGCKTSDTNPFRYCGEYYDSETGLIYLRNRYYDSTLGRFISEDPARDGTNWYVYCENNPVGFIDPLGLESYIFYTTGKNSDFSKQAQWQKQYQERQGEKVIMRTIDSVDDFVKAWGRIGVDDKGYTVTVNKVIIYSHSNGKSLILLNGSENDALSVDGTNLNDQKIGNLSTLYYKNIRELYLLGCNTGNLDLYWSEESNVASVMSNRISGVTYAYDGNVSFGKSSLKPWDKDIGLSSRLSTRQISFNRIAAANGRKGRSPRGKIQYYQGEYKIYGYYPNTRLSQ